MIELFENNCSKTYVIAEMSANHAGSLERAKEIIHAAKGAGADCIKLQTYTPDTMTIDCDNPYFQISDGTWKGENLYHLYQKAYTPWEWQKELKAEAGKTGLDFLSTPFDKTAVDFLEALEVNQYKIASFELIDLPLVESVASKNKPILLSTGMGSLGEIQEAVDTIRLHHNKIVLLKCSSAYPAVTDGMNLQTIKDMADHFKLPVGLSDHSLGSLSAVIAVSLGAKVIEKHFCLSRKIENPDASFSMEPKEFEAMVKEIRAAERAIGQIQYGPSEQEKDSIPFRRSIFTVRDIEEGELFSEVNIRIIRPGDGMPPKYFSQILGKEAACRIERGMPIQRRYYN